MPLDPDQRRLRSQIAAAELHSRVNGREHTAPARAASPGALAYWEARVDPEGVLDDDERHARAQHARRAHMLRLSFKSAKARRRRAVGDDAA
jgi:hypothetical protein